MTGSALDYLNESAGWYTRAAGRARVLFFATETLVLVVAAAIPVAAAFSGDRRTPAILGAVVVVITGLRSVFRWRDSWTRFTGAFLELETARQLYLAGAAPYASDDRDVRLMERVLQIRTAETLGWIAMRSRDDASEKAR